MPFSFGYSPWLLLLCLLGAAALTAWTYSRTRPRVTGWRRAVLMTLRGAALFIVLLLLFEPIWRRLERTERPPVLAVLVDDTQSLSLTGDSTATEATPLDLQARTREAARAVPSGRLGGATRLYGFGSEVRGVDTPDSLRFQSPRTDIAGALEVVRDQLIDQNLQGVVLISDGQYNTGRNPLYVAERFPVPIYTVAVGDTTRRRDVQVARVATNEIAYVDTELPIQVGIRSEDYGGERVVVSLTEGGAVLASEPVVLPSGTGEAVVDLAFTPEAEGFRQLTVAVSRLGGEVTYRNNAETTTIRVLENKRRLLVLGAAPSPDFAQVRQLLEADPNVDVVARVQRTRGTFYEGALPDDLSAFDALVLVGYPGASADPQLTARLAAAAEAGTPLLFLLTRQTNLAALDGLRDVLPAIPDRRRPTFAEASFHVTPRGAQHPILERQAEAARLQQLPPLLYNESRWSVSPDARVLATVDVRGVTLDDPLLVVRDRAGSRAAALLGAGTWRWRNLPDDLEALQGYWPRLFDNLLQWLTTPEDNRRVRVEPITDIFAEGEAVQFTGQVYDESLNPVTDASVTVRVTTPDETVLPFTMDPVGSGRYVLRAGTLPEGTYRYEATAERSGTAFGDDEGTFAVGGLSLEFKETRADAALLRQLAQRSGGTLLAVDELGTLADALQASGRFEPLVYEATRETPLWHLPWLLAVVVGLLAAEWVLRKRSGMV